MIAFLILHLTHTYTHTQLWALLHFIMPTMFDSHEEFNEWFSKDIESHAEKKSALDQEQLSRLHMILKPFMLRRIKRDVEHEMAEKVGGTLLTKSYPCVQTFPVSCQTPVSDCLQYGD